jgi:hypothetical protein
VPTPSVNRAVEVKCRAAGLCHLYDRDYRAVLIVKDERQEPMVVDHMSLAAEIANGAA